MFCITFYRHRLGLFNPKKQSPALSCLLLSWENVTGSKNTRVIDCQFTSASTKHTSAFPPSFSFLNYHRKSFTIRNLRPPKSFCVRGVGCNLSLSWHTERGSRERGHRESWSQLCMFSAGWPSGSLGNSPRAFPGDHPAVSSASWERAYCRPSQSFKSRLATVYKNRDLHTQNSCDLMKSMLISCTCTPVTAACILT